MKVLIFLILTQSYRISNGENSEKIADTRLQRHEHEVNECENIKEEVCSLCLQIPGCAWCTLKVNVYYFKKLFVFRRYRFNFLGSVVFEGVASSDVLDSLLIIHTGKTEQLLC